MANFKSAIITTKGTALIAKAVAGKCNIAFTKMSTSDAVPSDSATSLTSIKQNAVVGLVERQNDTNVKVSTSFDNTSLKTGYYVKTVGLYALDPDDGEILYCFATVSDTADFMPPYNNIGTSSFCVDIITAVSNADNVTVQVNPTAYATVSQIMDLYKEINDVKGYIGYGYENVWGVEVDFKNNKFTRLGAAEGLQPGKDFDNFKPWKRRRCMIDIKDETIYYYGEGGFYNGTGGDWYRSIMVEQPVFYTKVIPLFYEDAASGEGKQLIKARYFISEIPLEGFKVNEAFVDANGTILDNIYLAAYESTFGVVNKDGSSFATYTNADTVTQDPIVGGDLKIEKAESATTGYITLGSVKGCKPVSGKTHFLTLTNARILADNMNYFMKEKEGKWAEGGWCLHNIFALAATQWLMLIEYASFDCQTYIGKGVSSITDDNESNLSVITGNTSDLGNASGMADGENGKVSVSYRGEENLWGNIWTWLDGINIYPYNVNEIYVGGKNVNCVSSTKENYHKFAANASHKNGYVSAFGYDKDYDYLFIPTACDGASNKPPQAYYAQQCDYASGFLAAELGGRWNDGSICSAWFLALGAAPSARARYVGCRLLYVPQDENWETE